MPKITAYFFSEYRLPTQTRYFKYAMYTLVVINVLYWFRFYDLLFGQHSICFATPAPLDGIKGLAFILYNDPSFNLSSYFLISLAALCIMAIIMPYAYFFIDLLIWLLMVNIHTKIYPTLTGGDFLLDQLLFFNCFLSLRFDRKYFFSELKICLHNFAVTAIMIEVCVLYFLSAISKIGDISWREGSAISAILQIDHFSMYSTFRFNPAFSWIYYLLNYLILIYQLLFGLLIWLRPLRIPLLILGVLIHLYISFVMGLLLFGLVMLSGFILFYPLNKKIS